MQKPPTPKRKLNYLSNGNLLVEIAKSKNSYSVYLDDHHAAYDEIIHADPSQTPVEALSALDRPLGCIVRLMAWDHVPEAPERDRKPREKNRTHAKVSFPPFMHFELTEDGWQMVGKSHWVGGLHNGHFSNDHGRLTEELGKMIWLIAERYASRGSWRGYSYRDEMVSTALENLMAVALQFDESRTQNPFAFYTTCLANSFRRVWRDENKQQAIRDDLRVAYGQAPSMTRQVNDELAKHEPTKLTKKRGRPKANKAA